MKSRQLLLCAALVLAGVAQGADMPMELDPEMPPVPRLPGAQEPGWQAPPASTGAWADRCTDFTINGWAFKDPANFTRWVDVFSDPGIHLEFARRAMEPRAVTHALGTLLDPAAARNYAEWANPVIYEKWAAALTHPDFYTRVNATLFDPGKMMNWVMLPTDPRPWALLGTAMNPAQWAKWMTAPFDLQVWAPLLKALPAQEQQEMHADEAARGSSGAPRGEAVSWKR